MNLEQYLGKDIRVTFVDGHVLEGRCHTFTGKLDTEEELYDEITIATLSLVFDTRNNSFCKILYKKN